MPFDGGAKRTGFASLEDMLLDMVEFALAGGKKWARCNSKALNDRRFCLVGAVILVCHETQNEDARDQLVSYLARAIRNWQQRNPERILDIGGEQTIVVWFNNDPKRRFTHIVEVIREARELAQIDAYVREMERKAGRSANRDPAVRRLAAEPIRSLRSDGLTARGYLPQGHGGLQKFRWPSFSSRASSPQVCS